MRKLFYVLLISGVLPATWATAQQTTFVLVHGAWGGGWSFKKTDSLLRSHGHAVYRVTLTGQGERAHLASPDIGLDTHIKDVVNTILFENLHDVVLMGHSYGGMVITGVADSIPGRIRKMIYLDALLPEDGQSLATAFGQPEQGSMPSTDGFIVPAWVAADQPYPKDVPQSAKTFTQPLSLKNTDRLKIPTTYILTFEGDDPDKDAFAAFARRADDNGWKVIHMQADHNPQMTMPDKLAQLLDQQVIEN
ncbi:alpha/beta hydrolase [Parapedobacter sp. ISTM3]|uniref:Pimeloyl-ACP methyl ester carboxylesterase n=1 Tax=Parapedobacter luteus TaxID=623280 RepID=A0A1T5CX53_9SPHI|nr:MULTISPECIES: alpha/beta hydrolase [Parapedobacter]MBK1440646.1 alpha/beta hydrolase [Parapedobacter sp. ISTM3]SKB64044.1 Pimeloyl-ACP methyl ester carboxylesterase [Parapedobacter luteus]